jgi:hypothetical protein
VCQIDRLQRKSAYQASEAIKSLPKTIEETYETIFLEIPEDDQSTARTALRWIMSHSDLQGDFEFGEYPYGIPAAFLSHAILKSYSAKDVPIPRACHEHDFVKNVLGCLVEVTFDENYSGDLYSLCGHGFMLAHYTITEFLTSDRVRNSTAKYFAMSQDVYAQDVLDAVLSDHNLRRSKLTSEWPFQRSSGYYYDDVARGCAKPWETILIQNQHLQERHYCFFIQNLGIWTSEDCFRDTLGEFEVVYQTSNDTMALRCQYILALYTECCYALAETLLQKMHLETTLSTLLPMKIPDYLGHRSSRTLLGLICRFSIDSAKEEATLFLLELCRPTMNPSQLLIHYLCAHCHYRCVDRCCDIARILEMGANSDYPESTVRPLQLAVQCCDYTAVRLLLNHGAIVNGTGKLHGYYPAHVETRWWRASPLHILRNEEYWFMARDFDEEEKVRFPPFPLAGRHFEIGILFSR